jgi:hypothetical protein
MAVSMSLNSQQGSQWPSGVLGVRTPPLLFWLLLGSSWAPWRTRAWAGARTIAAATSAASTTTLFNIARGIFLGRGGGGRGRVGAWDAGKIEQSWLRGVRK